ncbi:hypothetical protein HK100_002603, partial [Physocladia obscura]
MAEPHDVTHSAGVIEADSNSAVCWFGSSKQPTSDNDADPTVLVNAPCTSTAIPTNTAAAAIFCGMIITP